MFGLVNSTVILLGEGQVVQVSQKELGIIPEDVLQIGLTKSVIIISALVGNGPGKTHHEICNTFPR